MTRRLTIAQQNAKLDDQKWEASFALVRAYGSWNKIQKEHGPFSKQSLEAEDWFRTCLRKFKRLAKR